MFKKNEYIVVLNDESINFKRNYVYKQREDFSHIRPLLDIAGSSTNGFPQISWNNENNWRYATNNEVFEYDRIGKPYNVTKIKEPDYSDEDLSYLVDFLTRIGVR